MNRNSAVRTKLVCVSEKEAMQMGRNLVPSLMTEQLAEAGANEWRVQNRAVKELMKEQIWFKPMAVVLGMGIVKTAAWGVMARVIVGAVLSVADLLTDFVVLQQFWNGGEDLKGYRNAQLASLATSIGFQVVCVTVQNRKKCLWRILKELVIVLTGLKAPVDAYRVASGAEKEKDTEIDPTTMVTYSKCIEMFAESIPGILIQASAILITMNNGDEVLRSAYFSLFVSILTTGFVSASISYDYDTDPKKRAHNPEFYGLIPDAARKRSFLFVTMLLISAIQILTKVMLVVIIASIKKNYASLYIGGDFLFYLIFKAICRDYRYWIPMGGWHCGFGGFADYKSDCQICDRFHKLHFLEAPWRLAVCTSR
ncbi:hypothetical protein TL16_g09322 [Triparma laevis f. inornata]|uniref:Uncharacterized protein n=1 Tax=Triparma laevis f. inornata TaxID=1714386 RepID=A0A9W7B7P7_9STRA|nr:hypothetical protein TL16_g09322 [Triparma laevis f. inornata]